MNVVPAQIAGVESIAVASPPQRDNGGLPDPGVLAACALLGVTEVYAVGGAQAIAVFGYGAGRLRAGGHGHRPGQRLRDGGQAAAARADRHRLRGRADRGRHPRRRHRRPGARGGRPDQPGRARPARRRGAGHRPASGSPTPSSRWCPARSPRPSTPTGSPTALDGSQSGHRARRRPRRRACAWSTPTPPSTWRSRPRDARAVALRVRNAGRDLRRGRGRRSRWATTAPAPTTCCPPAAAPGTPAACPCSRSCAASTSSTTTSRRWPRSPAHIDALAGAEDLPAHAAAVRVRQTGA